MAEDRRPRRPVFISYAGRTNRDSAQALAHALPASAAFLDVTDIEPGDSIPAGVLAGLLDARVVVVFADATFFTRRYCREELAVALHAYRVLGDRRADAQEMERSLLPIVIALGEGGSEINLLRMPGMGGRLEVRVLWRNRWW